MSDALRSEWTKLSALRGVRWSLLLTLGLTVLLTLLVTGTASSDTQEDPLQMRLAGVYLGQFAVAWLGVMAISSEFTSGMIRSTFVATPRRHVVLAAKVAVVGVLVLASGLIACTLAYLAGSNVPGVPAATAVRGIVGTAVYLAALALFSLGFGAVLRNTAAAISVVLALLWLPLIIINLVPMETGLKIARLCPMFAGLSVQRTVERADSIPISPGGGLALFCGYAVAALALGFWLVRHRDA
jgi:ABC-2 type transport system permease protein